MLSRFIEEYASQVLLNMNDILVPGSDCEPVSVDNINELKYLETRFGPEGVTAFVAVKRGCYDFKFFKHKRGVKLPRLEEAVQEVYKMVEEGQIDICDWNLNVSRSLSKLLGIPDPDSEEYIVWICEIKYED